MNVIQCFRRVPLWGGENGQSMPIRIWVTIYYAHSISVKVKLLSELLSETLFQYLKALSEFY